MSENYGEGPALDFSHKYRTDFTFSCVIFTIVLLIVCVYFYFLRKVLISVLASCSGILKIDTLSIEWFTQRFANIWRWMLFQNMETMAM